MNLYKQQLNKQKYKLLLNSLMYSGLGFVIVSLLSIGYSFLVRNNFYSYLFSDGYFYSSLIVSIVLMVVGVILRMKWSFNIANASWTTVIFSWIIYIIIYTGIIAPLITLINDPWIIFTAFGICGICLLISGALGYSIVNTKIAFNLIKIIFIFSIVTFFAQLIFIIPMAISYKAYLTWQIIFQVIFALVSVGMLTLVFYNMSKTEVYYQDLDNTSKNKVSLYFGLFILILILDLFIMLLRLISFFKN